MERVKGIEPSQLAWKARALPLSYTREMEQKTRFELATLALARRCSTTEPLLQNLVRVKGVEPSHRKILDPKSSASANSAIPAIKLNGDPEGIRTLDLQRDRLAF